MANKLVNLLQEDLHFERKGDSIIGTYGSRWYSINRTSSNTISLITSVNLESEAHFNSFINALKQLKKQLKFHYNIEENHKLTIIIGDKLTSKSTAKKTKDILEGLHRLIEDLDLKNSCFFCNKEGRFDSYLVAANSTELCPECINAYNQTIGAIKEENALHGSYLKGFLGALVGALLGSILWVVVSYLGYLAALVAFAMAYLAYNGYKIAGGRYGKGMPMIIIFSIILAIIFANVAEVAINLMLATEIGLTPLEAIRLSPRALFDNELFYVAETWKNIGMGLLFGILGSIGIIRQSAGEGSFKNMEIEKY
ncbi:MAG: hypothetical protein WBI17_02710 [Clostridiaceae bacterium]